MCLMCGATARVRVYYSPIQFPIYHLTPFLTLSRTAAMDGRGSLGPVEPLTCQV